MTTDHETTGKILTGTPDGGQPVQPEGAVSLPTGAVGLEPRRFIRRRAQTSITGDAKPVMPEGDAPGKSAPLECLPGGLGGIGKGLAARRRVQTASVPVLPKEWTRPLVDIGLMTPEEVAKALRLEGRPNYRNTLRHLHRTGRLQGVIVAGRTLYPRKTVEDYIAYCMALAGK